SRRRHTRFSRDWSSDVCSSDLSVGAEHTFSDNLSSEIFMLERLQNIAKQLENRLKKSGLAGKTITLKIKYSDFTLQTRSKTLPRSEERRVGKEARAGRCRGNST